MSIDLSQFISTFLEESYEGLEVMESSLLNMDSADEETINTIFRAAHSIKGGAGTFGFSEVADFTHVVETLLDELRSGKQQITSELTNLLLESVDCIKMLLEAAQDGPDADLILIERVQGTLEKALGVEGSEAEVVTDISEDVVTDSAELDGWKITFNPELGLLQSGHEPSLMFQVLADYGELTAKVNTHTLPELSILDPENVYLQWELELRTDCSEEEVNEVFEWVEDECELHIISSSIQGDRYQPQVEWDILFTPAETIMETGNELSFILEALAELGPSNIRVNVDSLPILEALNPEKVYLSWHISLQSACEEQEIREVFEWVEDECQLNVQKLSGLKTVQDESNLIKSDIALSTSSEVPALETPQNLKNTVEISPSDSSSKSATSIKKAKPAAENSSIRVDTDKVDALINRVGELVITQAMLGQVGDELAEVITGSEIERLQTGLEQLERNTRDLQEDVMRVRMLPISFVFNRFPRLVHDVSGKLGKKVELIITGEQTEIDKTVMEKIGDPMVHLIRNSLDHGLETPEERAAAGKSETGKVELKAYHQGGYIIIDITDDGRGLNTEKIYQKALEKNLISEEQALSDDEINELVFKAGFSTADAVSDLSGRGVGMDVVRRNIESLGGHVSVKSEPGHGSTFSVSLPLTLAILDGQLVRVDEETYIIPLIAIVETILATHSDISPIAGEEKLLHFRDEYIPLINLRSLFKLPLKSESMDNNLIAIVESGGQKIGLIVDELFGQQQVVIKSLEVNFKSIEGFAGATILGNGRVALILDVEGLIKRGLNFETAAVAKKRNDIFESNTSKFKAAV